MPKKFINIRVESVQRRASIRCHGKYAPRVINHPFWGIFIPGVRVGTDTAPKRFDIRLTLYRAKFLALDFKKNKIGFDFSYTGIKDLIVIVGYLLEKARQKDRHYSIHGSLITRGKNATAFIGGLSGMGKTSLAMYFAENGWKFISDDKFIISGKSGKIVACTERPFLTSKLRKSLGKNKIQFNTIETITDQPSLKLVLFPVLIPSHANLYEVFKYGAQKLSWHLYEESSRDIRLINGLVDGFSKPLPSLDEDSIALQRSKDVKKLSKKIPAFFVLGNKKKIYNFVSNFTKSST